MENVNEGKITLYDFNKSYALTCEPFSEEDKKFYTDEIVRVAKESGNKHFMLQFNDIKYTTVFRLVLDKEETVSLHYPSDVWECLSNIGEVKVVHTCDDNAINFWVISDGEEDEAVCGFLFPADGLVIDSEELYV